MNMERINVAELLENCPKGMELNCSMFENVTFEEVVKETDCDGHKDVSIILLTHYDDGMVDEITLTEYGTYTYDETAKCVIFPKGKTSWEGFKKPFVNGDIVTCECNPNKEKQIFIFKEYMTSGKALCHAILDIDGALDINESEYYVKDYATEQEKEKLFEALAQVGCKWNEMEKKLENIDTSLIPIFKVGDEVQLKNDNKVRRIIDNVFHDCYTLKGYGVIHFKDQNDWEIPKFDIKSLKPFDKVLTRDCNTDKWHIDFFEEYNEERNEFQCITFTKNQCIPFKNNEYLMNTTNQCREFYQTWNK